MPFLASIRHIPTIGKAVLAARRTGTPEVCLELLTRDGLFQVPEQPTTEKVSMSFPTVKKIIERELNNPLSTLFLSIAHTPIYTDSISHSYRATLRNGTRVLVTVLIPARIRVHTRILIFARCAALLVPSMREGLGELFSRLQTVYLRSGIRRGQEIDALRKPLSDTIQIPAVQWSHTSRHVLTTEYIRCVPLDAYIRDVLREGPKRLEQSRDVRLLAQQSLNAYVERVLSLGHAILDIALPTLAITPEGRLTALRLHAGFVSPIERGHALSLLRATVTKDRKTLGRSLVALGTVSRTIDLPQFQRSLDTVLDASLTVMRKVSRFTEIARLHGIRYRETVLQFLQSLAHIDNTLTIMLPDGGSAERVSRRPSLRLRTSGPYQIDRFAKRKDVSPSGARTAESPYMIRTLKPQVLPTTPAHRDSDTTKISIIAASLFVSSALTLALAPAGLITSAFAVCFLGLGVGSGWHVVRK